MTQELVIIQGPPGTGKTYIGLKIMQLLLRNTHHWQGRGNAPILVVCYTNHALDQFLEGILPICTAKGDVIRIGGRGSKDSTVDEINLSAVRSQFRRDKKTPLTIHHAIRDARQQMDNWSQNMGLSVARLEMADKGIISHQTLAPFIQADHLKQLQGMEVSNRAGLDTFLNVGETEPEPETGDAGGVNVDAGEQRPQDEGGQDQAAEAAEKDDEDDESDIEDETTAEIERRLINMDKDEGDKHAKERKQREELYLKAVQDEMIWTANQKQPAAAGGAQDPGNSEGWQQQRSQKKKAKKRIIHELVKTDIFSDQQEARIDSIWNLTNPQRWRLYRTWLFKYKNQIRDKIRLAEMMYANAAARVREAQTEEDYCIAKNAKVIALTTTGAAKYHQLIQKLAPKIVILEEAAEVLEAHVITTLTPSCHHLVLIGDHKQLRPKPTVYELAERYNLKISLFERLINNGLPVVTLQKQHRMRPEISLMMRKIYPRLEDHESVRDYPNVKGVADNIYFIDHGQQEDHNEELISKGNKHEAEFVAAFCRYLLQQGYDNSQITILTPYSGQLFKLKKLMPNNMFPGIRKTLVDNFQGEENDIILLSLVRSNMRGDLGFLKEDNRVCVALSRAKVGLYVIGNFTMLQQRTSLWDKLVKCVEGRGLMGKSLSLYCQNHREDGNKTVTLAKDFKQIPEGGCMKPCAARLECGHACTKVCHPYDPEHKQYKCQKPCERSPCPKKLQGHTCKKLCHQDCGKCSTAVKKVVPRCGHEQKVPCSMEPAQISCRASCELILQCGHKCSNVCGDKHTTQCREKVERQLPCGHNMEMLCFQTVDKVSCGRPCGVLLKCQHTCTGTCGKCFEGRLHLSCKHACGRGLVCGHACKVACTRQCPPCKDKCQNQCIHSNCTKACGELCVLCQEPCAWSCPHFSCSKKCSEPCNRPRCNRPCSKILQCGHPCIGLCGENCPDKCRVCDKDEVTMVMFGTEDDPDAHFVQLTDCGHIVEVTAMDKWMEMTNDARDSVTVQLKACPICKTTIRKNLRYGRYINQTLKDIEEIKKRIEHNHDKSSLETEKKRLLHTSVYLEELNEKSVKIAQSRINRANGSHELHYAENLLSLLTALAKIPKNLKKSVSDGMFDREPVSLLLKATERLEAWAFQEKNRLSDQELEEAPREVKRLQVWSDLIIIQIKSEGKSDVSRNLDKWNISGKLHALQSGKVLTDSMIAGFRRDVEEMKKVFPAHGLAVTEAERIQIVKAMNQPSGHWFKCPRGHYYVIGDCGGAMVVSKCPECGSAIGGQSHRLLDNNAHAGEMDGSRAPAWSEVANLANFDPQELERLRLY